MNTINITPHAAEMFNAGGEHDTPVLALNADASPRRLLGLACSRINDLSLVARMAAEGSEEDACMAVVLLKDGLDDVRACLLAIQGHLVKEGQA